MINPYVFGGVSGYSSYNLARIFSVYKTDLATIDYCCKIKNSTSGSVYVFYDSNDEISMNGSQVSTTTTPNESTTLQDFVDTEGSSSDYYVTNWYCQISGVSVDDVSDERGIFLIQSGALVTKDGIPAIYGDGTHSLVGSAVSELDDGIDFVVSSICSNDATARSGLMSTRNSAGNRFNMFVDRTTSKYIARRTSPATVSTEYASQIDNNTRRRLVTVLEYDAAYLRSYLDGAHVDDVFFNAAQSHDNVALEVFGQIGGAELQGHIQWLGIHNDFLDATAIANLDNELDTYFTF